MGRVPGTARIPDTPMAVALRIAVVTEGTIATVTTTAGSALDVLFITMLLIVHLLRCVVCVFVCLLDHLVLIVTYTMVLPLVSMQWGQASCDHYCPPKCRATSGCQAHSDCDHAHYCDNAHNCYVCSGCHVYHDAVDGACPSKCENAAADSCEHHNECTQSGDHPQYCDNLGRCWDCGACAIYDDAIDQQCPSYCNPGGTQGEACTTHTDCNGMHYCDRYSHCWICGECSVYNDAIDETCPSKCDSVEEGTCTAHNECADDMYCDTNSACYPCPYCRVFSDAIDGTCPRRCTDEIETPCTAHSQCTSEQYCDRNNDCWGKCGSFFSVCVRESV